MRLTGTTLVVDDEPLMVRALTRVLARAGLGVHTAQNGEEALHLLTRQPVDVVLCDVRMPVMDGPTMLARLRERFPEAPPVVFLTGYREHSIAELHALGAAAVLAKPVTPAELLAAVRAHVPIIER